MSEYHFRRPRLLAVTATVVCLLSPSLTLSDTRAMKPIPRGLPEDHAVYVAFDSEAKHVLEVGPLLWFNQRKVTSGQPEFRSQANGRYSPAIAVHPKGRFCVLADGSELVVRSFPHGEEVERIRVPAGPVSAVAIAGSGHAIAGVTDKAVEVFQYPDLARVQTINTDALRVALSSDGALAALGYGNGHVELWNVGKRERLLRTKVTKGELPSISTLSFSPDDKEVLAGCQSGHVALVSIAGEPRAKSIDLKSSITAVSFSSDGKQLAVGTIDNDVTLIRKADMSQVWALKNLPSWPVSLAFAPDNKQLACGLLDGTCLLFDLAERKIVWKKNN